MTAVSQGPAVRDRRRRLPAPVLRTVAPVVLGVVLLTSWLLASGYSALPVFVLPSPGAVVAALVKGLGGSMWPYIWTTLAETLLGCVVGAAIALPLAVVIHRSRWVEAAVHPFLGATQAIPAIALAPLLVLWVGYGLTAVTALCSLMVFFPILVATVVGLRHVDSDVVDAARIDGATSWARLWYVELPLSLPSLLAGARNGFALAVTGAVVGEMVMGGHGLGMVLTVQRDALDTAGMFATIIVLCVLASLAYSLILTVERRSAVVNSQLKTDR